MEAKIIATLSDCLQNHKPVALVTITTVKGSAPGKPGAMMVVEQDGTITGTVGGGSLEHKLASEALAGMALGQSREISFDLAASKELEMVCGGQVSAFIKVFVTAPQLLLVGAGHISLELYRLALLQGFRTIVFDTREELLSAGRYPRATRMMVENIAASLRDFQITTDCFITIATASHEDDKFALEAVIESDARYIGMIGSSAKIKKTFRYLLENNVPKNRIARVFAPMGLNIASVHPREIALAIFSEILLVKNNGSPESMRDTKKNLLPS